MRTLRYAATGFALGVGWGVVGRVWMRLISTEPSFSWSGTLQLVGMAGLAGLLLGVAFGARRRGGSVWWRMLGLPPLVLFAGAGLPLVLAVVVGGWGLRRGPVARVVAGVALLSAPVALVAMSWEEVETWLMPYPDNVYRLVLAAGALLLGATAAWGTSIALGPWRDRTVAGTGPAPARTRIPIG